MNTYLYIYPVATLIQALVRFELGQRDSKESITACSIRIIVETC